MVNTNGTITNTELIDYTDRDGYQKTMIQLTCSVVKDDGDIVERKGVWSRNYANKYLRYCNISPDDLIGKDVAVLCSKKQFIKELENGEIEERQAWYAKFINLLDKDGKAIIMPSDKVDNLSEKQNKLKDFFNL